VGKIRTQLLVTAALAAFVALSGSVYAADLGQPVYRAAPMPPPTPVLSWTGWYVGLNAGGAWSEHNDVNLVGTPTFISPLFLAGAGAEQAALGEATTTNIGLGSRGQFIGGGQVGYNYQFATWVAGFEADIQGLTNSNNTATVSTFTPLVGFAENYTGTISVSRSLDWLGTVRGRLGFLATPSFLIYGTGGFAYGGASTNSTFNFQESLGPAGLPPIFGSSNASNTQTGWAAGAGAEWMFAPNWTARVEYLHYDLGTLTSSTSLTQLNLVIVPGVVTPYHTTLVQSSTNFAGDIVRAGINYKFNW
jgi:outer membrane immunogenic protein